MEEKTKPVSIAGPFQCLSNVSGSAPPYPLCHEGLKPWAKKPNNPFRLQSCSPWASATAMTNKHTRIIPFALKGTLALFATLGWEHVLSPWNFNTSTQWQSSPSPPRWLESWTQLGMLSETLEARAAATIPSADFPSLGLNPTRHHPPP